MNDLSSIKMLHERGKEFFLILSNTRIYLVYCQCVEIFVRKLLKLNKITTKQPPVRFLVKNSIQIIYREYFPINFNQAMTVQPTYLNFLFFKSSRKSSSLIVFERKIF